MHRILREQLKERNQFFNVLSSIWVRYHNDDDKVPSAQLESVTSLIWQHVSTSKGLLQASSIKYTKGIYNNFIQFRMIQNLLRLYIIPSTFSILLANR